MRLFWFGHLSDMPFCLSIYFWIPRQILARPPRTGDTSIWCCFILMVAKLNTTYEM